VNFRESPKGEVRRIHQSGSPTSENLPSTHVEE
jgi:hypothetical protein